MMELDYLKLGNNEVMPPLDFVGPYKCVLIIESFFSAAWQAKLSERLIKSGCRYLITWGPGGRSWTDAINRTLLERYDYSYIPPHDLVMSANFTQESLLEAFAFCRNQAKHNAHRLAGTLLLHIADQDKSAAMRQAYMLVNSLYWRDQLHDQRQRMAS